MTLLASPFVAKVNILIYADLRSYPIINAFRPLSEPASTPAIVPMPSCRFGTHTDTSYHIAAVLYDRFRCPTERVLGSLLLTSITGMRRNSRIG